MDDSLDEAMQRQNLSRLLEALRRLPLRQVTVNYAGSSGHVTHCEVLVSPSDADHHLAAVIVEQFRPAIQPSAEIFSAESLPLGPALKNFALHWAGMLDESWPRGDGGNGTMRLHITEGVLTLDHDVLCIQNLHASLRAPK